MRLRGVEKGFETPRGRLTVLRGVDQEVGRGDAVVVTGHSGSGKTTLLHVMGLLDEPCRGQVELEGREVSGLDDGERSGLRQERIGMVFQRFFLLPRRSALENVMFRFRYGRVEERRAKERAMRCLEEVGLGEVAGTEARLLSGGEMQRVAIARALVSDPALLLADEPTGNLDGEATERVMELFEGLRLRGVTMVVATHNLRWVEMATRHWVCDGAGGVEERR